jgi:hypothetical protein
VEIGKGIVDGDGKGLSCAKAVRTRLMGGAVRQRVSTRPHQVLALRSSVQGSEVRMYEGFAQ